MRMPTGIRAEARKLDLSGFREALREVVGEELDERVLVNAEIVLLTSRSCRLLDFDKTQMVRLATTPNSSRAYPHMPPARSPSPRMCHEESLVKHCTCASHARVP